ncbi:hypothetical protein LCGC14_0142250 [marine sediment metagenome]|uniref:Serine protease n=1 Tax=marine sediment metagenome TaxID=412755 RepID=A0A0F9V176_9ZZZZ
MFLKIVQYIIGLLAGIMLISAPETVDSSHNTESTIVVSVDTITLKQKEMRDVVVLVGTHFGNGSGTIIDRLDIDEKEVFEYRVLTNAHVIANRIAEYVVGADVVTGKPKIVKVNYGCSVLTFDHQTKERTRHKTRIVAESIHRDLALLSFESSKQFAVVKLANQKMLEIVRVFDEVYAVGCQLGNSPSPTFGIVSQILTKIQDGQEYTLYTSTAHIAPGSSGGGLFKFYDGHYYLIGIPFKVDIAFNGQFFPHLSYAISMTIVNQFIDENVVCDD